MKKKILFVIPSLAGGGAEKVLVVLLKYIDRTRFKPIVVVFEQKNDYTAELPSDVRIISLNKKSRLDNLRLIWSLSSVIRKEMPDLICGFLYYANYFSVLAMWCARRKIPLVFSEHNNLSLAIKQARLPSIKKILVRNLYRKSDGILCVSDGVRKDLIDNFYVNKEKCRVIHNPVEIDRLQLLAKEKTDHPWFHEDIPIIITCGRLTAQKNHYLLLRSAAIVSRKVPVRIMIVGDGELKADLISYAARLGISDSVDLLGFQQNPFKFMARSKLFVLSSSWEGFGNVLVEAMTCGVPVISTNCPSGPAEIISNGLNGLLVPVDNENAMADAILRILEDENLRIRLIQGGTTRCTDFREVNIIRQYEILFEKSFELI